MKLNRIQVLIFEKLGKEKGLETDAYITTYAMDFIGVQRDSIQDLSEEEGDTWINKAYFDSLSCE